MSNKEDTQLEILKRESAKEEREFRDMLPADGFIAKYMKYTDLQESPGSYHFWVALTILSAVIQRRAWVSKGVYNVYPNLYTILVAPTGRCRKSRAISLGAELIQEYDFINIIADKTTPESMLEALMVGTKNLSKTEQDGDTTVVNVNPDNTALIKAGELSVFLNKQSYTAGMVTLLTDLYDSPKYYKYHTRNKKPVDLHNVAVTFIGASTPDWLASSLPEEAFEGGFMSRIVFVVKSYRDRSRALPEDPPRGMFEDLQRDVLAIRRLFRGRIELSREARDWYLDWYSKLEKSIVKEEIMVGFVERKPDTLLKLTTLMMAASEPDRNVIYESDFVRANRILTWTQERMFKAFKNIDLTVMGRLRQKILDMLDKEHEIARRDILRRLGSQINGIRDLEDVQAVMEEAGEIEVITEAQAKGRPKTIYRRVVE